MNESTKEWASVCIKLLQGPVYEDDRDAQTWKNLLVWQLRIASYFADLGLSLFVDTSEGYAFLSQEADESGEIGDLPRLIRKIPLTFEMSILCVILREALEQFDSSQNESKMLVMRATEIKDMVSVYLKDKTDRTRLYRDLNKYLNQAIEMTFLREIKNAGSASRQSSGFSENFSDEREYEVRRILKAKIDTQFLEDFRTEMEKYLDAE